MLGVICGTAQALMVFKFFDGLAPAGYLRSKFTSYSYSLSYTTPPTQFRDSVNKLAIHGHEQIGRAWK